MPIPPPPPPFQQPGAPQPGPRKSAPAAFALDPQSLLLAMDTLQQRIDQLQQSLAQQNKLATLGMITAVIAHEFNNILTPMISYTKFALTDKSDDALREKALNKALTGAERLANISKSLLGFARGEDSASANVLASVRETLGCLARDLAKDGISLTLNVADNLSVAMNAGHLQQVLMNLIVNARSAMISSARTGGGSGGGLKRLTIRATTKIGGTDRKPMIELLVSDTGPGIPAEVLPRIFEPFFSTKRGTPQSNPAGDSEKLSISQSDEGLPRGGTGLGLTICRELINAAGGNIRATSESGLGATFILDLPAA